jgi:flagellar biosynthesis/type III secretory pathway chaperone
MRTTTEMELISKKTRELSELLCKEKAINLRDDHMVKGVLEFIMDELDISNQRKAVYLYKALGKYI